ncbi:MAG: glutamate ligase domain-containing protein, partial [Candidatus Cryptobacteroides sp.]
NVGKAHLLGFGSFEGVMRTKGELYDYLRRTSDKVFVNVDNPHLCRMAAERCLQSDPERPYSLVLPYGLEYSGASVLPASPEKPFLRISLPKGDGTALEVRTGLVGAYNADNVMAALAVGTYFGVELEDSVRAIEGYVPSNNRSQMKRTERNTLIVDAYNANPTSMAAALDNFSAMCSPQPKILMLGDMLELGEDSAAEHKSVIEKALKIDCEHIFLVGGEFGKAMEELDGKNDAAGGLVKCFSTSADLAAYLSENPVSGRTVLVKGSRGTRMENVVPTL